MINKSEIHKIANKILHRQAGLHDIQIMHPTRDWLIGLAIAVSIFLVGAAASAQLYFSNMNTTLETNGVAPEVIVYRESIVETALERLQARDEVFSRFVANAPINDVSIIEFETATTTATTTVSDNATTTGDATSTPRVIPLDNSVLPAPL